MNEGDHSDPLQRPESPQKDDSPPPYESIILEDSLHSKNQGVEDRNRHHEDTTTSTVFGGQDDLDSIASSFDNFEVNVVDPVKQGEGVSAYISYRVVSTVHLDSYGSGQREVIRRFRDFTWLRDCMRKEFAGIILPALPPRNVVEKYKMTPQFVEDRRRALQVFLKRVLSHPLLRHSEELRLFLQASESEFAIESSRISHELGNAAPAESSGASSFASKTLSSASKFFKSISENAGLVQANIPGSLVQQHVRNEESPEYAAIKNYYNHLEAHLNEVHQQAQRLTRQHARLAKSFSDFGLSLNQMSVKIESMSDDDGNAHCAVLGKKAIMAGNGWDQSAKELHVRFEAPLRELLRSIRSAKRTIEDRDECLVEKIHAQLIVDSKRSALAKMQATPGTRQDRIMEAERHLQAALKKSQETTERYTKLVQRMDADIIRFQKERAGDLKHILLHFAQIEKDSYMTTSKAWMTQS
ncbi:hypothetical protein M9435_001278 [Picochlorum sp. BPE23]|nr:hypothetical protein M9435_001278 [Picochlorum sp. BPE23]